MDAGNHEDDGERAVPVVGDLQVLWTLFMTSVMVRPFSRLVQETVPWWVSVK
jgi:hypothetical protein